MNVKLRTGLVENYDAVYVERKNQNCLDVYKRQVQFSKMFKKYAGVAPSIYRQASFKTE